MDPRLRVVAIAMGIAVALIVAIVVINLATSNGIVIWLFLGAILVAIGFALVSLIRYLSEQKVNA